MHFEILVEDVSGKQLLDILEPKIIDTTNNTYKIISYKGLGRIPKDLQTTQDPSKRILLEQLPRLIKGYGRSFTKNEVVIVVVDCDNRPCKEFKEDLKGVIPEREPKPNVVFSIAIEEIEAWLLGDKRAIETVYPNMNNQEYAAYQQDSVTRTWEKLADITLHPKAAKTLKKAAFYEVGKQKSEWAKSIGANMDVNNNASQSFNYFKKKLEEVAKSAKQQEAPNA
jgi:hypothetical protein